MAAAKGKVGVSAEIPEQLRDQVDERAKAEGRSRNEVVERSLRYYLEYAPVVHRDALPTPKHGKKKE